MDLFKRCICFTDIHLGLRANSKTHNEDCLAFIEWFINEGKSRDAETCIFLGDFFHHRNTVNSQTLEYAIKVLSLLNDAFKHTYFLVGNHDLYFRESRSVTSLKFAKLFPNITLVDEHLVEGDVALVPWLVEDEWKEIEKIESKYVFGHFEIPGFKMNAMVEMPDHGGLNKAALKKHDYVFSGHFHKRQTQGKIQYIGNPFGHNYADVWDFERGAMFLEWDGEPEYIDYTEGPRFIAINLAALLEDPETYLKPKTYLQVTLDVDISYEEATFIKETFLESHAIRELKLIRKDEEDQVIEFEGEITFQTVDQIVVEGLNGIDKGSFDSTKLIEIYNSL